MESVLSKEYEPRMHTAEHVLNQTMERLFGCERSYSCHLNAGKSKCDYRFPRPLTDAEAEELETRINAVLTKDLPVREVFMSRAEAAKVVDLSKLPAHLANAPDVPIRIVSIGDYDVCPCIGEHVENTRMSGLFRIVSHDFTQPDETGFGRLRVRFKLDPRDE